MGEATRGLPAHSDSLTYRYTVSTIDPRVNSVFELDMLRY